ncbi:RNA-binding domain-containing protein [Myriangium duriaei CBS 260.36]|uniref:RNA-binding domain-containing protein n=1 Tax=Myriangium duriaei CBS 260.36 TaxID=1168546 RepID=A0A9P4J3E5_9PEZI|nr:RNA-binding domain-containing protein [Myriangium duriaei CBS 260.36]
MASKLDQSLDEIAGARRSGPRARRSTRKPNAAPAGGVAKKPAAKPAKPTKPAATSTPSLPTRGESKIIVSNLPDDVDEQQIKEYFGSTVGPVKRVFLNYTKNGRSTGVANIVFSQPNSAATAAKSYNGIKVDGRPMKIEVVMGAQYVPEPAAPKTLKDRIVAPPKSAAAKPKPAGNAKGGANANAANTGAATGGRGGRNGRGRGGRKGAARPKKTAEELDADMADYFVPPAGGDAAPPAADASAPNGGEAVMDEIN